LRLFSSSEPESCGDELESSGDELESCGDFESAIPAA
jgi:hypothetical protein